MDAADSSGYRSALASQGQLMGEQQQCLDEMDCKLLQLSKTITQVSASCTLPMLPAFPTMHLSSFIARPHKFSGLELWVSPVVFPVLLCAVRCSRSFKDCSVLEPADRKSPELGDSHLGEGRQAHHLI